MNYSTMICLLLLFPIVGQAADGKSKKSAPVDQFELCPLSSLTVGSHRDLNQWTHLDETGEVVAGTVMTRGQHPHESPAIQFPGQPPILLDKSFPNNRARDVVVVGVTADGKYAIVERHHSNRGAPEAERSVNPTYRWSLERVELSTGRRKVLDGGSGFLPGRRTLSPKKDLLISLVLDRAVVENGQNRRATVKVFNMKRPGASPKTYSVKLPPGFYGMAPKFDYDPDSGRLVIHGEGKWAAYDLKKKSGDTPVEPVPSVDAVPGSIKYLSSDGKLAISQVGDELARYDLSGGKPKKIELLDAKNVMAVAAKITGKGRFKRSRYAGIEVSPDNSTLAAHIVYEEPLPVSRGATPVVDRDVFVVWDLRNPDLNPSVLELPPKMADSKGSTIFRINADHTLTIALASRGTNYVLHRVNPSLKFGLVATAQYDPSTVLPHPYASKVELSPDKKTFIFTNPNGVVEVDPDKALASQVDSAKAISLQPKALPAPN